MLQREMANIIPNIIERLNDKGITREDKKALEQIFLGGESEAQPA